LLKLVRDRRSIENWIWIRETQLDEDAYAIEPAVRA
jgi:hypothetical protein